MAGRGLLLVEKFAVLSFDEDSIETMEIQTILLPTDFSKHAERTCKEGLALAAREKARVLLLHVLLTSDPTLGDTPLPMREEAKKEIQADAEHRLRILASGQTVPVETLVVW